MIGDGNSEASFTFDDDGKRIPAQFPERDEIAARIEGAKAEFARLGDEIRSAVTGFDTEEIRRWLVSQSAETKFVAATIPPFKLLKNESLNDALARIRADQASVADEIATVQNAPRTIAEAKAAMREELARLAEKGRPEVGNLFHGGALGWPEAQFLAGGYGIHEHTVAATVTDNLALTVWMHRDLLVQKLDEEIERQGDDTTALSREAQAARVKELEAQLLHLYRQEEAVIEQIEAQGQHIIRTCRNPEVLLGIERARA